jgi:hypothetical protein
LPASAAHFGEGLAIGQSAAAGEIALALTLIIGFGLHTATEGFGIVGPTAGETPRPGWGFLILLVLIGGRHRLRPRVGRRLIATARLHEGSIPCTAEGQVPLLIGRLSSGPR